MSDDDRPVVPTYKREALQPPPAHLLGASPSLSPSNGATRNPPVNASPPPFKFADPGKNTEMIDSLTETIMNAGDILHRVLVQRINFHESESKKLRSLLNKFAGSQQPANVAPSGDDLSELLRIARQLEDQK